MRGRSLVLMFLVVLLAGAALVTGNAMGQEADAASPSPADGQSLWSKSNLVAWCIVPFDSEKRQPQERAAMLRKLGLKRLAYDYRAEHVPQFEEEILALQAEGIELTAWWFPTVLNDEARLILALLKKHQQTPQLWVMGSGEPADGSPEALEAHLQRETERIQLIADAAGEIGCRVGLYNHGGWFGEPKNQIAIIRRLNRQNVGIVYNLHHGHAHLDDFPNLLQMMKPHLLCLNLNGMVRDGDAIGKKIMPIAAGELDLALMQVIADSGYTGLLGVLNHTDLDAELRLQDNLIGLDWLAPQLRGSVDKPRPRPEFRTWSEGVAEPRPSLLPLSESQRNEIDSLLSESREQGDARRGLTVFASLKTSCFSCHKVGNFGGTLGPDLTHVGNKRSGEELVASLLWPNQVIEEPYRVTIAALIDGTTLRGYRVEGDSDTMSLLDPATGMLQPIPLDEIEETRQGLSLMPAELMTALSRRQQVDLIRFLLDGINTDLSLESVDGVLQYATVHTPQPHPFIRDPLEPEQWPNWQAHVNRDRIYDFYTKQAEYFRSHPHGPLVSAAPALDSGLYGHWGNQNEETWRGNEWNEAEIGSLQAGVFNGDGVNVARGICVRIGPDKEYAVCFNPDRLSYEIVWKGFVSFSDFRHGFMDGLLQKGATTERPENREIEGAFEYQGFYRHGDEVIFAYRMGDVDFLDHPTMRDGKFERIAGPRTHHPLRHWTEGGAAQWPDSLPATVRLGGERPYAIDTFELPVTNPWRTPIFGTGLGFLPDGSILMATMHGDVWHVQGETLAGADGLEPDEQVASKGVTWRRFAAGLHQPLGIVVDAEGIFVMCRDQLVRLHDLNQDGEADYYECFANQFETSTSGHDYICGLERDGQGRFYTASGNQGLLEIAADGSAVQVLATGFRNPDGTGLYPDGVVTVPCSEGDWTPASMICGVRRGAASGTIPTFGYRGPRGDQPPELPMVYLPRLVDNSAGGQVFVTSQKWGPLAGQMLHLSFGTGTHHLILRDEVDGQLQGAAVPLPGDFLSGVHRGQFSPRDGQLYVCGMGGWGSYTPDLGCLQRVRYRGDEVQMPTGFHVHQNGVAIQFAEKLDAAFAGNAGKHFAQCWNYRYSGAYGSPEFSTRHFGNIGHDPLDIIAAHIADDGRTLFLELPELQPVNQLHLRLNLSEHQGFDLFATVHRLDRPRQDLPGYREVTKAMAPHPILADLNLLSESLPNPWSEPIADAREIKVSAGKNLTFEPRQLRARAGEILQVVFSNPDAIPHNWVLIQSQALERVGDKTNRMIADPMAYLKQYVPESEDVICYTNIVEAGGAATIYFTAPSTPGRYPFLCTFPGHWMVMNGELIVE